MSKKIFLLLITLIICVLLHAPFSVFIKAEGDLETTGTAEKASVESKEKKSAYDEGLNALKEGQGEKAVEILKGVVGEQPNNVDAYIGLARAYILVKNLDEAEKAAAKAVELSADNGRAQRTLGRVYALKGDKEKALEAFTKACEVEPNSAWNFNNAGFMLIQLGKYNEAVEKLEKAVQLNPSEPLFQKNLDCAKSLISAKSQEKTSTESPETSGTKAKEAPKTE